MDSRNIKVYAISGSLRENSYNTALMNSLKRLAPENYTIVTTPGIGDLPYFNPDIDDIDNPPTPVRAFRKSLVEADCVVLFSPEYAHNIPGVLKNALDWLVASGELVHKPVVVTNTSTSYLGGDHAHKSLKYLVKLLSADLLEEASFSVNSAIGKFNKEMELVDEETNRRLQNIFMLLNEHFKSSIDGNHV